MTAPRRCPCGLGDPYDQCCGRLHRGETAAATAEQLMRSRYSAFAVGDTDYLRSTWHPSTRPKAIDIDPEQRWTGLEITDRSAGGPFDSAGTVTFRAHYRYRGADDSLAEHSRFEREGGRWSYVDGDVSS